MKRLDQLNILRFLAAVQIVVFHYAKNAWPFTIEPWSRIPNGPEHVVSFFFVLSGFVMVYGYYDKASEGIEWKTFMLKRLSRFLPLYLASLILIFPFRFGEIPNTLAGAGLFITMLQAWVPPFPLAFNTPAWAMSGFVAFYAVFPAVLRWMRQQKTRLVLWATAAFWIISQLAIHLIRNQWYQGGGTLLHDFLVYNPVFHFNSFLVGMAAGLIFKRRNQEKIDQRWNAVFLTLALLAGVAVIFFRTDIIRILPFKIQYTTGLESPLYMLIILLLAQDQTWFSRVLSKPILKTLGDLGLSIYLLQTPLVELYKQIFLLRIEIRLPWTADWHFYIYFAGLLVAAILVRYLFEDPLQRLIRGRLAKQES